MLNNWLSGNKNILICGACQSPWCKYSLCDSLPWSHRIQSLRSREERLRTGCPELLAPASSNCHPTSQPHPSGLSWLWRVSGDSTSSMTLSRHIRIQLEGCYVSKHSACFHEVPWRQGGSQLILLPLEFSTGEISSCFEGIMVDTCICNLHICNLYINVIYMQSNIYIYALDI